MRGNMSKQDTVVASVQTPENARKRRFAATNEPSVAPGFDKDTLEPNEDAVKACEDASNMSGGKTRTAGSFESMDAAVKAKQGSR